MCVEAQGTVRLILGGHGKAGIHTGIHRRERDLPEITGRMQEFNSGGEFTAISWLNIDNTAILMLLRLAIDQTENLPHGDGSGKNHQSAVSAHALHLGQFAKKLGLAFKGQHLNRNDQP